jgi:hypothetical protein
VHENKSSIDKSLKETLDFTLLNSINKESHQGVRYVLLKLLSKNKNNSDRINEIERNIMILLNIEDYKAKIRENYGGSVAFATGNEFFFKANSIVSIRNLGYTGHLRTLLSPLRVVGTISMLSALLTILLSIFVKRFSNGLLKKP